MQQVFMKMDSLSYLKKTLEQAYDNNNMELALACSNRIDLIQIQLIMKEQEEHKQAV